MSSILDALNKLEVDRAEANYHRPRRHSRVEPEFNGPRIAGRDASGGPITLRLSLSTILLGVAAFTLLLITLSVGASMMIMRGSASDVAAVADFGVEQVASISLSSLPLENASAIEDGASFVAPPKAVAMAAAVPVEEAPPVVVPAALVEEAPAASTRVVDDRAAVAVVRVAQAPVAEKIVVGERVAPEAQVDAVRSEVGALAESHVVAERKAVVAAPIAVPLGPGMPSGRSVGARNDAEPEVLSLVDLPVLTRADIERYTDGQFRINMLRQVSSTNPYRSAVINKTKVYEGQNIPQTRLQLIAVDLGGIGVRVQDSNLRFFVPF